VMHYRPSRSEFCRPNGVDGTQTALFDALTAVDARSRCRGETELEQRRRTVDEVCERAFVRRLRGKRTQKGVEAGGPPCGSCRSRVDPAIAAVVRKVHRFYMARFHAGEC
jgi:hypothetical protein